MSGGGDTPAGSPYSTATAAPASSFAALAGVAGICLAAGYALLLVKILSALSELARFARQVGGRGEVDDAIGEVLVIGGVVCVLTASLGNRGRKGKIGSLVGLAVVTGGFAALTRDAWDWSRGEVGQLLGGMVPSLRDLSELVQLLNVGSIIVAALSGLAVVFSLAQPHTASPAQGWPHAPPSAASHPAPEIDVVDDTARAALRDVVRRDDVAVCRAMLARHPGLLGAGEHPLLMVVTEGSSAMLDAFLDAGAAVDARDERSITALTWACGAGGTVRREHAQRLLRRGADPSSTVVNGWTPLMYAARFGDTELVEELLTAGAAVNAVTLDEYRTTALLAAAHMHHEATALLLLDRGADPTATSAQGASARTYAAQHGLRRLAARIGAVEVRGPAEDASLAAPAVATVAPLAVAADEVASGASAQEVVESEPAFTSGAVVAGSKGRSRTVTAAALGLLALVAATGVVVAFAGRQQRGPRPKPDRLAVQASQPAGSAASTTPPPAASPIAPSLPPVAPTPAVASTPRVVPGASRIDLIGWDSTRRRALVDVHYQDTDGDTMDVRVAADPRKTMGQQLGGAEPGAVYQLDRRGAFVDPGLEWLWQTARPVTELGGTVTPSPVGARSPANDVWITVDAEANPREGRMSPVEVVEIAAGYRVTWRRWPRDGAAPSMDERVRASTRNVVTFVAATADGLTWDLLPLEARVPGARAPDEVVQEVSIHWADRRILITVNETADQGAASGNYYARGTGPQIKILYPPGAPASGDATADQLEAQLGWASTAVEENSGGVAPGVYFRREPAADRPFDIDAGNPAAARRIRGLLGLPRPDKELQKLAWIDVLVVLER